MKRLILFSFFISSVLLVAQENELKIGNVYPGEMTYSAFTLGEDMEITISGTLGNFERWDNRVTYYAWIIDADDRSLVWHIYDEDDDYRDESGFYDFESDLNLDKGNYEVYLCSFRGNYFHVDDFGDVIAEVFSRKRKKFRSSYREKLNISLKTSGRIEKVEKDKFIKEKLEGAIVSLNRAGDDENFRQGFKVTEPVRIRIYAIGEGRKKEVFDYAWIYDTRTREKVWAMDPRKSDYAGGNEKNIMFNEILRLEPGNYMVAYLSDDSHSWPDWNAAPPNDPEFYGITIWPATEDDKDAIGPLDKDDVVKPVMAITGVGDDEYISRGLRVKERVKLHVIALGEMGHGKSMADYGKIYNADTRETIWEMRAGETRHAGGARKNRIMKGDITLDPGNYVVMYVSDDSHSYEEWNSAPPFDRELWGISLWPLKDYSSSQFEEFDPDNFKSKSALAEITRVRDDARKSKTFTLERETKVRIIALGEGDRDDMYDYGWIKNMDTGQVVWEMTYRKTEHAGGARKNRLFNGTIILDKGEYKVYYTTDGSHSYGDWNSSPPHDQELYGIIISKED